MQSVDQINHQLLDTDIDEEIEVTLPRAKSGDSCLLESYNVGKAEQLAGQKKNQIKRLQILKDMQINPQRYFNFGFTIDDYIVFLLKQTMMRAERQVIEQEYTKYLDQKNFKLKDDKQ